MRTLPWGLPSALALGMLAGVDQHALLPLAAAEALRPEPVVESSLLWPSDDEARAVGRALADGRARVEATLDLRVDVSASTEALLISAPGGADAREPPPLAADGGVLIECAANRRWLIPVEGPQGWLGCAGTSEGADPTPLAAGLFVRIPLAGGRVGFRHAASGRWMQLVPPRVRDAWVVRLVHRQAAGAREAFAEVRTGGATYLRNDACGCHVSHRFGTLVRGHDATGRPAGANAASRLVIQAYGPTELRAALAAAAAARSAERLRLGAELSSIRTLGASNEVRVISYGLYGADDRYTIGAIRNAQLAPIVYPGWGVRFYVDQSVPRAVQAKLRSLGAHLVQMGGRSRMGGAIGGMFWRFLVASDDAVDRFVVRDCDSRLSARERLAVEEWISGGAKVARTRVRRARPARGAGAHESVARAHRFTRCATTRTTTVRSMAACGAASRARSPR